MLFSTEQEFEQLFRQHYSWLVRIAARITADNNAAEDLVQEAFINLWQKRETLEVTGDIKGYLRNTVVNRSLNYLRGRVKFTGDESLNAIEASAFTDSALLTADTEQKVNRVLQALPQNTRLVFTLSRFEEMSYRQIAGQLNVSVKMVEKHMSAALKHIRNYLPVLLIAKFFPGFW
jgi:RNA polymerase sigma-70 factor, ECF subfamily